MSAGPEIQFVRTGPMAARVMAGVWWRATKWSLVSGTRAGLRLSRMAADPVLTAEVVAELAWQLRDYARDLLGVNELEQRVDQLMPGPSADGRENGAVSEAVALRLKGALLLRAAAEVGHEEPAHPAYAHILTELAPDEGRILRLLATDGPQPMVDVRAIHLIGVGSDLVEAELNMVGAQAGCQFRDRVPAYLNNLERLGLIEFSDEALHDAIAYQVLEAQPEVMEALKRASRAKTSQRSIRLTPFGKDFCETCLPLDIGEVEALVSEAEHSD